MGNCFTNASLSIVQYPIRTTSRVCQYIFPLHFPNDKKELNLERENNCVKGCILVLYISQNVTLEECHRFEDVIHLHQEKDLQMFDIFLCLNISQKMAQPRWLLSLNWEWPWSNYIFQAVWYFIRHFSTQENSKMELVKFLRQNSQGRYTSWYTEVNIKWYWHLWPYL